MRHNKGFNHLGRTSAHRNAMLSNMASSLILHKRITTTTAKAKALRSYIEPLITKSKDDTTHSRRVVFSYLKNKYAVSELFREVSPKIIDRPGGYTRILKTGNRLGDNAEMCIIELVDYNENMLEDTAKKTRSTRRRRGSGKAKADEQAKAEAKAKVEGAIADDVETTTDIDEVKSEETIDVEDMQSETQEEAKAEAEKEEKKKAEVKAEGKKEEEERKPEEGRSEDADEEKDS